MIKYTASCLLGFTQLVRSVTFIYVGLLKHGKPILYIYNFYM